MEILTLLQYVFGKVVETFSHNWALLVISIVVSAALQLYVNEYAIVIGTLWIGSIMIGLVYNLLIL